MVTDGNRRSFELLTVHGLTWLLLGNAVGLLLATLLLFPGLGDLFGAASFGRWMPLHLNFHLYGWCGLALTGLLFRIYLPRGDAGRLPAVAIGTWSGAVLFGAISWLTGHSDGKIFLEWSGPARALLTANLTILLIVLIVAFVRRVREDLEQAPDAPPWRGIAARAVLLAALVPAPLMLLLASSPRVYPPINPDSGGATGGSLMGSTLLVVAIILACPLIVGLSPRGGMRAVMRVGGLLLAHAVWFGLLDHSDHSNHEWLQVVSLASLVIWIPVLYRYLRRYDWPAPAARWLAAFCGWGALLTVTGALMFLPGVLEHLKFTNALVAHAHLALAGMATSFNVVVLITINSAAGYGKLFGDRRAFVLWQGGCVLFVLALTALGAIEGLASGPLFRPDARVVMLYSIRWLAGATMLWASARWLTSALRMWRPA